MPEQEFTLGNYTASSSLVNRQAFLPNNVNNIPATESNEDPNNELIPEVENDQILSNTLPEENYASYSTSYNRRINQYIRNELKDKFHSKRRSRKSEAKKNALKMDSV